ncbi:winged helix-turn-helix transcriptional regulator [Sphingomonas histidinilytica]|jgi:Lrp/AsnC family transcriptional regulator|nr:Lrp/AsnC family transcriptional regulator [Rhizorhabdus histidinilytica]MBO9378681.1 winged helix-turn-helix transcriptional regulator [Rhizorhabdus histidinilytica]QEH77757.1 Lrp/AsnC family transcriptional regulator [Sphingomonas sp. C8-2]
MMEKVQLDSIDRKLLRVLQRRADISQAALAEEVGSSPASCWRRLKALEEAGVLGPTVRLLNPQAVGKTLDVVCQVRMKAHDVESRSAFESFIVGREEVMECLSMSGEWDYQIRVTVSDMAEYEDFLMRRLLAQPAVAHSASHFALKRIKSTTAIAV